MQHRCSEPVAMGVVCCDTTVTAGDSAFDLAALRCFFFLATFGTYRLARSEITPTTNQYRLALVM